MLNTDGKFRLVFCTTSNSSLGLLHDGLKTLQFIGNPIVLDNNDDAPFENEFYVGDSFLSSVTFMGCSPYFEFELPENFKNNDSADFCFIRLASTGLASIAYHSEQYETLKTLPRCQHCRKVLSKWNEKALKLNQTWQLNCPHCNVELSPSALDWRKASGVGNVFIEVMNVYLQEAVPTEVFIKQLEVITDSSWSYFYTDTNIKTKLLDRT